MGFDGFLSRSPAERLEQQRIPAYAGYLFDLDGTLIDTAPDLTRALNHALAAFGHAPVRVAQARNWVGQGAKASLLRALAHFDAPTDNVDAMLDSFLDHYRRHIADFSAPFPGVEEALQALADRGAKLAVVTNKREELTNRLLAEIDFAHHFQAVVGGDSTAHPKPGGGPGPRRLRRLAGAADRCAVRWRLASGRGLRPGRRLRRGLRGLRLSPRVGGGRLGRRRRH